MRMPLSLAERLNQACARIVTFSLPDTDSTDPLAVRIHDPDGPLKSLQSMWRMFSLVLPSAVYATFVQQHHAQQQQQSESDRSQMQSEPEVSFMNVSQLASYLDDLIQEVLRDLVDDWACGRRALVVALRLLDDFFGVCCNSVDALWVRPISMFNKQIIRRLMYLATHLVFVQNDFGSSSPVAAIGYEHVCAFVFRGLIVARKTVTGHPDSELLAECVAMWEEHPRRTYAATAASVWTDDLLNPKRCLPVIMSKQAKTPWSRKLCFDYMHLTMTLIQAHLAVGRAVGLAAHTRHGDSVAGRSEAGSGAGAPHAPKVVLLYAPSSSVGGASGAPAPAPGASGAPAPEDEEKGKQLLERKGVQGMGMPSLEEELEDDEAVESGAAAAALASQKKMPRVRVGNRFLRMHSELIEMRDSTPLYVSGNFEALRSRLETEGFLFVRGVIPPATVRAARMRMLAHLRSKGAIRDDTPWEQAFIEYKSRWKEKQSGTAGAYGAPAPSSAPSMIPGWTIDAESGGLVNGPEADTEAATQGWHDVGNSSELVAVYNGPALQSFYSRLFGGNSKFTTLPNCTWLRAKGPGEVTAEHIDYYYFAKNSHIFGDHFVSPLRAAGAPHAPLTQQHDCQICHDPGDEEHTLICDLCDRGFHMSCVRPRITVAPDKIPGTDDEQEWHCFECQNLPLPYWTCWVALGDISGLDGRLALIPGSHRLDGVEAPVRDGLIPRGYTKAFESSAVWQTPSRIDMGDIILFNIKLVHGATRNAGERFRLSLDTRVRGT